MSAGEEVRFGAFPQTQWSLVQLGGDDTLVHHNVACIHAALAVADTPRKRSHEDAAIDPSPCPGAMASRRHERPQRAVGHRA
jgi:hypothetical protein